MTQFEQPLTRILAMILSDREQQETRIARLLHDDVGQVLSAAGLQLDVLRMDIEKEAPAIARRISENQKLLEQAVESVRTLSYELNPAVVERAGLGVALERLSDRYGNTSDVSIQMLIDSSIVLPIEVSKALYKIAESALDNAIKHAHGDLIKIQLRPNRDSVMLEINDNGVGFDCEQESKNPSGLGLLLMQCYAEQAGVKLSLNSTPELGTIVRAEYTLSSDSHK